MKNSHEFEISHFSLAQGVHSFNYVLEDSFFEQFAQQEFKNAKLNVDLDFDKKSSLFIFNFSINGSIIAMCDRCGDDFELQIWDEFELVGKLCDADKLATLNEEDNDVIYFSRSENTIDIRSLIYEQVILSLPIQILHPENEKGESTCNPESIALLKKFDEQNKEIENNLQSPSSSSSWKEQLNKIKTK